LSDYALSLKEKQNTTTLLLHTAIPLLIAKPPEASPHNMGENGIS
jgi:hypothetical protein